MSDEMKAWWAQHHSQYTVRDITALPLYASLERAVVGYSHETEEKKEECEVTVEGRSLRRELKLKRDTETIKFDSIQQVWTYQHSYREADADIAINASKTLTEECGEVELALSPANHSFERWRITPNSKEYERFSVQNAEKRGVKNGQIYSVSGPAEVYTLTYSENLYEAHSEKTWQRGDTSGCEKRHKEGDHISGESWVKSRDFNETKTWHIDPGRDHGLIQGSSAARSWTEKWDKSADSHFEERIVEETGRVRGFRYEKNSMSENRQEWEGEVKKRKERGKASLFLDEVRTRLIDEIAESERTINALIASVPSFALEFSQITQEKKSLPISSTQDSLISLIRSSFAIVSKQERLKQKIIDELQHRDSLPKLQKALESLQKASETTLKLLNPAAITARKESVRRTETESSACEKLLEVLQDEENAKFTILNQKKSALGTEDKAIRGEIEGILTQENAIFTGIREKIPNCDCEQSLTSPAASMPTIDLIRLISEKQKLGLSLLRRIGGGGGKGKKGLDDEEWESFPEEGSDQGLVEIRSKLTSLIRPYQALIEERQPGLLRELASLESAKPSLESLPSLFSTITQAVRVITNSSDPGQSRLTQAVKGLSALIRTEKQQNEGEEFTEETVIEEEVISETSIEEIMTQVVTLESIVSAKDEEISNLKRQMTTKDRIQTSIREEIDDLRRFKGLYFTQKDECDALQRSGNTQKIAFTDLKLAHDQLKTELLALQGQVKGWKEIETKAAALEKENQSLKGTLAAYKQASGGSEPKLTSEIAVLHGEIREMNLRLTSAQERCEGLLAELRAEKGKKERQLLLRIVSAFATTIKSEKTHIFLTWRIKADVPLCNFDYHSMQTLPEISLNWMSRELFLSDSEDSALLTVVEQAYAWVRKVSFETSPVFQLVSKGDVRTNSLLPGDELFARIEEAMAAKSALDCHTLQARRIPGDMGEFLAEHVLKSCEGNSIMASELMSRILTTLYIHQSHQSPLPVLFARLISVFDPYPVLLEGSLLVSKYSQRFSALLRPPASKPATISEFILGRSLPLSQLLASFHDELSTDRDAFAHLLLAIQPKDLNPGDFLCALVQFHASKAKRADATYLWSCFKGIGKGASVSRDIFVGSLSQHPHICLSAKFLSQAFANLAKGESLTEQEYSARSKAARDGVRISQAEFLTGIVSGFECNLRRSMLATAKAVLRLRSQAAISEQDFTTAVSNLNASLPPDRIANAYKLARRLLAGDTMKFPQFLGTLALSHIAPARPTSVYRIDGLELFDECQSAVAIDPNKKPVSLSQFKSLLAASGRLKPTTKS